MHIYKNITKHKNFNGVHPYTYIITDTTTNQKYYGVRFANIKKKLSPVDDLGVRYFSSSKKLKKLILEDKNRFVFEIHWTFDSIADAIAYEHQTLLQILGAEEWLNKNAYPMFQNESGPNLGKKLSQAQKELHAANALGRKGFNDGRRNYLLKPDDPRIPGLTPGYLAEFRENVSRSAKNRPPRSQDYRDMMSVACTGIQRTSETREKMKISNKQNRAGRRWFNDGVKNYSLKPDDSRINDLSPGRILSEGHKEKIRIRNRSEEMRNKIRATKSRKS